MIRYSRDQAFRSNAAFSIPIWCSTGLLLFCGAAAGCMDRGIEAPDLLGKLHGTADQHHQRFRKRLQRVLVGREGRRQFHLGLFLIDLRERHLALLHRAMQQQPGCKLHQTRGQPHALGGIGKRGCARQCLRLLASRTVEIGRGFF